MRMAAAPTQTFARAPWQSPLGPKPARSGAWPHGFPWLQAGSRTSVELENRELEFLTQVARAASLARAAFALWAREDIGSHPAGTDPASYWQTEYAKDIGQLPNMVRSATWSCKARGAGEHTAFGIISNVRLRDVHVGWPEFSRRDG